MRVITLPVGKMRANCYLLINDNYCLIIDPGDEANYILEKIQKEKLTPLAILATHGHFDHLMAAGEIQMSWDIPFYISEEDLFLVKRVGRTGQHFLNYSPVVIPPKNIIFFQKSIFNIDNFKIEIIQTPGHTPGSICLYSKEDNIIFSGDTLFKDGVGRYDFSYASKEDLKKSLQKIFQLPEETAIYPGHGEETIIGNEKKLLQLF